jgi:hypothetical protein
MSLRVVVLSSMVVVAGCDLIPLPGCTEEGCASFLTVAVVDAPLADRDIVVTATVNGEVVACTVETGACVLTESDNGWVAAVPLPPGDTAQVALTVVEGDATLFDGALEITWGEGFRPNGPDCEPVCFDDASAQVNLLPLP